MLLSLCQVNLVRIISVSYSFSLLAQAGFVQLCSTRAGRSTVWRKTSSTVYHRNEKAQLKKTSIKLIYKTGEGWPHGRVHGYSLYVEQGNWHFHYLEDMSIYASINKLFYSYIFEDSNEKIKIQKDFCCLRLLLLFFLLRNFHRKFSRAYGLICILLRYQFSDLSTWLGMHNSRTIHAKVQTEAFL